MAALSVSDQLRSLPSDAPLVMGILNTTPDSFSDGGKWATVDRAVTQAERMISEGAAIIDVGGESTRPGASPVSVPDELDRVLPVIERLAGRCLISIDTKKAEVADAAVTAGAAIVNDVSASLDDVVADRGAGWIAMHMQGTPETMQHAPSYADVVEDVRVQLTASVDRAARRGIEHVWIDPGIGFGKTFAHNLELLRATPEFTEVAPVVVGVSRKSTIGELHEWADGMLGEAGEVRAADRLEGSVTAAVWAWRCGANIVRTHDVRSTAMAAHFLARRKRIGKWQARN